MSDKCKCGKVAVAIAYLPVNNIYAGLKETTEPVKVCSYHGDKAKKLGYIVELI